MNGMGAKHLFKYFWGIILGGFYYKSSWRAFSLIKRPGFIMDIAPDAQISIDGRLILGYQRWGSSLRWQAHPGQLTLMKGASLEIHGYVEIPPGVEIIVKPGAKLTIGHNTYFSHSTTIAVSKSVSIGSQCAFSWGVTILDGDLHNIVDEHSTVRNRPAPILISDHVWIGHAVSILKGVQIGKDSIVAAGAVVTKSFSANCVVGGVPAKKISDTQGQWQIQGLGVDRTERPIPIFNKLGGGV